MKGLEGMWEWNVVSKLANDTTLDISSLRSNDFNILLLSKTKAIQIISSMILNCLFIKKCTWCGCSSDLKVSNHCSETRYR